MSLSNSHHTHKLPIKLIVTLILASHFSLMHSHPQTKGLLIHYMKLKIIRGFNYRLYFVHKLILKLQNVYY